MRAATSGSLLTILALALQACSVEVGSLGAPTPAASAGASALESTPAPNAKSAISPAVLATELAGLEERFASMPKDAPERPALARQLAEQYVDVETAALREEMQAVALRDPGKEAELRAAVGRARSAAEKYYRLIVDEYPSYAELDKVLYYLAYEYEQAKDSPNARKSYYELIQKRPDSKYIPNAYLAFGEMFFEEAGADPSKWDLARLAYAKVIAYPPPKNEVYGYAWYKLAYVEWNAGDLPKALAAFKKTIDFGAAFAELPNAAKLAESARRDIIPVYALAGDPHAAYGFFRAVSGDPPGEDKRTLQMMSALAQSYTDTGHASEASVVSGELGARKATSSSAP